MGANEGVVRLDYNTFDVPDNITVLYEGRVLRSTGCFGTTRRGGPDDLVTGCQYKLGHQICCDATGQCNILIGYGPGSSDELEVHVEPNCGDTEDTKWQFTLTCPN
jgi:hypothetical protein